MSVRNLTARHIMSRSIVSMSESQSLPLASALMAARGIHHIPVVNQDNRLQGLLSHRDVLAAEISAADLMSAEERKGVEMLVPVSKLMTRTVKTVVPDTPLVEVVEQMLEHKHSSAPVLDADGYLVGIVTDHDLLRVGLQVYGQSDELVSDLMRREVATARPATTVSEAMELIQRQGIRHLPVIGRKGEIEGLVTQRDLLAYQRSGVAQASDVVPDVALRELLEPEPWSISPMARLFEAAQLMIDHRFGCLPVAEDNRLLGIVTQTDFLRYLRDKLREEPKRGPLDAPINYFMSTPVRSMDVNESVQAALELFRERGVSTVVVQESGRSVGILSQSDVLFALRPPRHSRRKDEVRHLLETPIRELMTPELITATPDMGVGEAAHRLAEKNIHNLVVESQGKVVGVFGTSDILLAVREYRIDRPLRDFMSTFLFSIDVNESLQAGLRYLERAGIRGLVVVDGRFPVGVFGQNEALLSVNEPMDTSLEKLMSTRFLCLAPDMPAFRAAEQAASLGVKRILVLEEGNTIGLVSASDFAQLLASVDIDDKVSRRSDVQRLDTERD